MGRRIPTIPFSGGKPVPGYELGGEEPRRVARRALEIERAVERRVREAAREIEAAIDREVHEEPKIALAVAGGVCALLGVFFGKPIVRVVLVAAGGYVLYRYARSVGVQGRQERRERVPAAAQSVKGRLP